MNYKIFFKLIKISEGRKLNIQIPSYHTVDFDTFVKKNRYSIVHFKSNIW